MFKRRKAVGTANKEVKMLVNFPTHGYFVVDSVHSIRDDWKNHVVAWSHSHGHAQDSATFFDYYGPGGDFIVLDADGRVV